MNLSRRLFTRRVNPSPDVRFPTRETVSICGLLHVCRVKYCSVIVVIHSSCVCTYINFVGILASVYNILVLEVHEVYWKTHLM